MCCVRPTLLQHHASYGIVDNMQPQAQGSTQAGSKVGKLTGRPLVCGATLLKATHVACAARAANKTGDVDQGLVGTLTG